MIPVPGATLGTPFGARSRLWSCSRNSAGEGIHTGADFPAPEGAEVVAARPGLLVWVNHGSAFGNHQIEVRCEDGTRDFYAHMSARLVASGVTVVAGRTIGRVGEEGNVTGPHLHFERHSVATGPWSCGIIRDPQPSLDFQEDDMPAPKDWDSEDWAAIVAHVPSAKQIANAVWAYAVNNAGTKAKAVLSLLYDNTPKPSTKSK
jgi:murein DD-endopeptidase MepM/ murein hydrolase activator NlpD